MKSIRAALLSSLILSACGAPLPSMIDGSSDGTSRDDAADGEARAAQDATVSDDADPDTDASGLSDASDDAARSDGGDAGITEGSLIPATHPREMRAAWVASVYNLTLPSRTGLTAAELRDELRALVARAASTGLNALFFQARPESDALYRSSIEPWSRFLTGTQGRDPGLDPLQELIDLAHAQAIEVHVWINPYRAQADTRFTLASNSVARTLSAHAIPYNNVVVMNPGVPEVRAHVVRVVRDIATRYAVDGVHFDDYFYPYPDSMNRPFPDSATYSAYQMTGGTMSLQAWRRDNVNQLVRDVSVAIREVRPGARFGISPFGIYRPGMPAGINGLDAYNAIACDPLAWVRGGHVDYIAPQLYWPSTQTAQSYNTLLPWWAQSVAPQAWLFAGNDITKIGTSSAWTLDEIRTQIRTSRAQRDRGSMGNVYFQARQILRDTMGVATMLRNEFYSAPALPPAHVRATAMLEAPSTTGAVASVTVSHRTPSELRAYTLYRERSGSFVIERVVPSTTGPTTVPLTAGRWAIAAVSLDDRESLARVVSVR
ncbi:MAG: family 10 glycosylhydrolase [Deltaproteobacteria bacterium]|nr:family 10 glycosylhydrolase [Deltaproteobacteria bacterium]